MNKNIIIAILVVVIIAVVAAVMFAQPGKMDSQINIINNGTFHNGEQVQFVLKDAQGNAIANEKIDINYNNEQYSVVTDSTGKGYLLISGEPSGKYNIVAKFNGNDKYKGSNAQATITIESDLTDNIAVQSSGSSVASTDSNNNYTNSSSGGSSSNSSGYDTPIPPNHQYYIPEIACWVSYDTGLVTASPNGVTGITPERWYELYGNGEFD